MLSFVAEYHHIYPGVKVNHPKRALSKLLKKGCPPSKLTRRYSKKVYTGLTMPGFKLHYYRIVNLHTWMSLSLASNQNLWDRWSIYLSIYLSYLFMHPFIYHYLCDLWDLCDLPDSSDSFDFSDFSDFSDSSIYLFIHLSIYLLISIYLFIY